MCVLECAPRFVTYTVIRSYCVSKLNLFAPNTRDWLYFGNKVSPIMVLVKRKITNDRLFAHLFATFGVAKVAGRAAVMVHRFGNLITS